MAKKQSKRKKKALSQLQKRFCEAYVASEDSNAAAAYVKAGYKAKGHVAESNASRLLKNAEVRKYIEELRKPAVEQAKLTAQKVLGNITRIGKKAEGDKKYQPAIRAEELKGRYLGMFEKVLPIGDLNVHIHKH